MILLIGELNMLYWKLVSFFLYSKLHRDTLFECCSGVLQGAKDKKRKSVETIELQISFKELWSSEGQAFQRNCKAQEYSTTQAQGLCSWWCISLRWGQGKWYTLHGCWSFKETEQEQETGQKAWWVISALFFFFSKRLNLSFGKDPTYTVNQQIQHVNLSLLCQLVFVSFSCINFVLIYFFYFIVNCCLLFQPRSMMLSWPQTVLSGRFPVSWVLV